MASSELKKMTVRIAGRDYPVRVRESEMDTVSRIASEINKKLNDLQLQYNKNDIQDCLSMIALTYAVDFYQKSEGVSDDKQVEKDLSTEFDRIHALLDSIIQS